MGLSLLVLVMYLWLPTKNHIPDGLGFAQSVEKATGLEPTLLDPNHLLYRAFGYSLYSVVQSVEPSIRALEVLRITNSLLSALCAYLLFHLLLASLGSLYWSGVLTALFAFSATWWKFSTDANSYIPSVLLILASFYFLLPGKRSRPLLVAVLHSAAMCFHQLAVFFFPVAVLGLLYQNGWLSWRRRGFVALRYSVIAFALTVSVFFTGFYLSRGTAEFRPFARWITSHSPEVSFSFDLADSLFLSLQGHLRLFLGGRPSAFLATVSLFSVGMALLFLALLGLLGWRLRGSTGQLWPFLSALKRQRYHPLFGLASTWIGVYVVFLFFWLPHNTFYRLYYLPAIILLVGVCLAPGEAAPPARGYRALLFVSALAVFNLAFYIYPYSRVETNPPLAFALRMRQVWDENALIYYARWTSDNLILSYFNPATTWKSLPPGGLATLDEQLPEAYTRGQTVWLDTTASDLLFSGGAPARAWLVRHTGGQAPYELENQKHHIRLLQIFPAPEPTPTPTPGSETGQTVGPPQRRR